ncbi:MAG: hypothetical protein WBB82_12200 [Limnothrix sp.]
MRFTWIPDIDFISNVIAFQVAVISIVIPLSLEVISRVSERYKSGMVTREFKKQREFYTLVSSAIASLISSLIFRFIFTTSTNPSDLDKFAYITWSYSNLCLALITIIFLVRFFVLLAKYISETIFLLSEFQKDLVDVEKNIQENIKEKHIEKLSKTICTKFAKKDFISNIGKKFKSERLRKIQNLQGKIITLFSGIGDLLEFELEQKKNKKIVQEYLNELNVYFQRLITLTEKNNDSFTTLFYTASIINHERELSQKEELGRDLQIWYKPEQYLVILNSLLEQSLRLYKISLNDKDYDFAIEKIIYSNLNILEFITTKNLTDYWVNVIFKYLEQYRRLNNENNTRINYVLSFTWYDTIIFLDDFNMAFLHLFNEHLNRSLKYLVKDDDKETFTSIVSSIVNSGSFLQYQPDKIKYKLSSFFYTVKSNFLGINPETLDEKHEQVSTKLSQIEKLYRTKIREKSKFEMLINISSEIRVLINEDDFYEAIREELNGYIQKMEKNFTLLYKKENLKIILFEIGAYAIFKDRFDFIGILLNYKQPLDSEAHWVGENIFPESLSALFDFYIVNPITRSDYWEDHHGSEEYFDLLFFILLLNSFTFPRQSEEYQLKKINELITSFHVSQSKSPQQLNSIKQRSSRLLEDRVDLFFEKSIELSFLNVNTKQREQGIQNGIIPFFKKIVDEINQILNKREINSPISQNKVQQFHTNFLQGYYSQQTVKEFLSNQGLYRQEEDADISDSIEFLSCINIVVQKHMFFDDWYIHGDVASEYGDEIRQNEFDFIMKEIFSKCILIPTQDPIEALEQCGIDSEDLLIVTNEPLLRYENLDPHIFTRNSNFNENNNLLGYLSHQNQQIEIFQFPFNINSINVNSNQRLCFFVDKSKLGEIIQYRNPCRVNISSQYNAAASYSNCTEVEDFAISIVSYSENAKELNKILDAPPQWLKDFKEKDRQTEELKKRVWLRILEKLSFESAAQNVGFYINLSD